ncbi:MAG: ClbS/DfsB family four-helix bundle protein [Peptostreptococcus sp.]|uniref:ClbS/DfsB family four-helix bundle protein n=1 Tax=Peptostreptococcus sp. TaxID=1262 RepID=UPI002FCAD1E1
MREYENKTDLIEEIKKTSKLFIGEFDDIEEKDLHKIIEGVDRSPFQMIAYQLGWINLIQFWESQEKIGNKVITPTPEYKWNKLGELYNDFYRQYENYKLEELKNLFNKDLDSLIDWINSLSNDDLFVPDSRQWASSTPSKWPIWKWIHINTVAPFKTFRTKIRKWKKLNKKS